MVSAVQHRVRVVASCLLASALVASACGDVKRRDDGADDDGGDDGDDGDGTDGGFSVTLAADRLLVRQGASAIIEVTIERDDDFDQPVDVAVEGLPTDVTAEPLTVAAGETAGMLTLTAASDSPQGAAATEVTGTGGEGASSAALRLLVAGPPGTLDLSFGEDGQFSTQIGGETTAGRSLAVQPGPTGDRILVTGAAGVSGGTDLQAVTIRLGETGALDDTFGSGGIVSTGVGSYSGGLVVTPTGSGRIVVGGWGGDVGTGNCALIAYSADGILDAGFGEGGTLINDFGAETDEVHQVLEDDDGRLLMISTLYGTPISAHVARYSATGDPDAAFTATVSGAAAETAILQADGTILVAGEMDTDFWLARYLDDGSPDSAFSGDGQVTTSLGDTDTVAGLLPSSGGKIIAIGISALDPDGPVIALARFNSNGSPDITFGAGGELRTPVQFTTRALNAIAVDQSGRILFAGEPQGATSSIFAVARLSPDGTVDDTFGDEGVALIDFAIETVAIDGPFGIDIDSDGRIVVSGSIGPNGDQLLAVARFWP